jgi:hypothetical protein
MKRFLIFAITALVAGAIIGSAVAGSPLPGSEDDPIVTKGYVDMYLNNAVTKLQKEIDHLEKQVADLEALVAESGGIGKREIKLTIGSTTAYINEEPQTIDTPPYLEGSTTMLPFKFIGDALGATVKWEGESKVVTFEQGRNIIALQIGSTTALVNGESVQLDVPPLIANNRTFVPLRFVSNNLGAKVQWINETKTIVITK